MTEIPFFRFDTFLCGLQPFVRKKCINKKNYDFGVVRRIKIKQK